MLVNGKGDITVCYTLLISKPEQILTDLWSFIWSVQK